MKADLLSDWADRLSSGAGFYLNATSDKYKKNYRMYDLITDEIPKAIKDEGLPIVRPSSSMDLQDHFAPDACSHADTLDR